MIRAHAGLKLSLLLVAGTAALGVPQAGLANPVAQTPSASGGAGLDGPSGNGGQAIVTQPASLIVSASGDGITVATSASAVMHDTVQFTGSVPAAEAGDTIEIERMGSQTQSIWVSTAQAQVGAGGSFTVTWRASQSGPFSIRAALIPATVAGSLTAPSSGVSLTPQAASDASSALSMTVYRPTVATWYGGSTMFGANTACGELLSKDTLGVANRTLPCGTPVGIYYDGRSIVVPVIDRGPYVKGVSWDLTEATAKAIGMLSVGRATIGTIALPQT
ncbi:MAG: septal ring lytic transglycosylase RlpA family protein [Solirubrobacteraceae bacterium]